MFGGPGEDTGDTWDVCKRLDLKPDTLSSAGDVQAPDEAVSFANKGHAVVLKHWHLEHSISKKSEVFGTEQATNLG